MPPTDEWVEASRSKLFVPAHAVFNSDEADRNVWFFENVLRHTKGRWAGQPWKLTPWQRDDIWSLYGWQVHDPESDLWVRYFTSYWKEIARKNGKSEEGAGHALQGLCFDGEEGAEVYGAAEDRDQASIIYRVAKRMVELSPWLSKRLKVIDSQKRIIDPKTDSFYQVLPRDEMGEGSQGFNPSRFTVDEVHVQKSGSLISALKRGFGTRAQPLGCYLTTAGLDSPSVYVTESDYSQRVLDGEVKDARRYVVIHRMPEDADPFDESKWHLANPAMDGEGAFLSRAIVRGEAQEAKEKPSELNDFIRFRCNRRVGQITRWIDMAAWRRCAAKPGQLFLESDLEGTCYYGLDLAETSDIAALALCFPQDDGSIRAIWRFWTPTDNLEALDKRTGGQASVWVRNGFLHLTPGNVGDHDEIEKDVSDLAEKYECIELGYDPWHGVQLIQHLHEAGMTVAKVQQTMAVLTDPTDYFEKLVYAGKFHHNNNPVMTWMVGNAALLKSRDGAQKKPDRRDSGDKIDGVAATLNALERNIRREDKSITAQFITLD